MSPPSLLSIRRAHSLRKPLNIFPSPSSSFTTNPTTPITWRHTTHKTFISSHAPKTLSRLAFPVIYARLYSSSSTSTSSSTSDKSQDDKDNDHQTMAQPTGTIATEGIELFTGGTPNGYKVSILLEELKDLYGDKAPKVTYQAINIMANAQKEPWYTAICPNGRIPSLVDHDRGDFAVFEGLAILSYLTKHYDPEHKLSFPYESDDHSVAEQWMAWQHGGVGPMQGQANHFLHAAKEKIPYGAQRYVGESERLYGILDARLKDRDYVAGPGRGKYSIADISLLGWANITILSGVDVDALFPNVVAWLDRCLSRPATKKGFAIPQESSYTNAAIRKKIEEDPEAKKQAEERRKFIDEAKAKYGYKYASP